MCVPSRPPVALLVAFLILSAADYALTHALLQPEGGPAYEANPVAAWCLARLGWAGLAAFKAASVLAALLALAAVARSRPRAARLLLAAGCLALAVTVSYSAGLAPAADQPAVTLVSEEDLRARQQQLDRQFARAAEYRAVLEEVSPDLLAGRRTLEEAVARLAGSERGRDPAWIATLRRRYPGHDDVGCLAANLCDHATGSAAPGPHPGREEAARRLRAELRRFLDGQGPPEAPPTAESAGG